MRYVFAHWSTLDRVGLAGPEPAKMWRGENKRGEVTYLETFQWKDADAPRVAHQTPERVYRVDHRRLDLLRDWLRWFEEPSDSTPPPTKRRRAG